jgi:cbb3-type cytochrome oxidase maturation protein
MNVFWNGLATDLAVTDHSGDHRATYVHGSWFGIGDGTVIMWPLVWVLLPIGIFAIVALLWATKNGQFRNAQEIAERQLEIED